MDIAYLYGFLKKNFAFLAGIFILCCLLGFLAAHLRKDNYPSNAVLTTGITNNEDFLNIDNSFKQQFEISSRFSNIIENLKAQKMLRKVSYQLLLHDLPENNHSFQKSSNLKKLDNKDINLEALIPLMKQLVNREINTIDDPDLYNQYEQLAEVYKYDPEHLGENLSIYRIGQSDLIHVGYHSENPKLSQYVVSSFCNNYLVESNLKWKIEDSVEVKFYEDLVIQKKTRLDELNNQITTYRKNEKIIDLAEQSSALVNQISELEVKKEEENKNIRGYQRNIENLNDYLNSTQQQSVNQLIENSSLKDDFLALKDEIKSLKTQNLVRESPSSQVNSIIQQKQNLQKQLISEMVNQFSNSQENLADQQKDLLEKRIAEEMNLALGEESVRSLDNEIQRLESKSSSLVSADAYISSLDNEKEIVLNEYLQGVQDLNEAKVKAKSPYFPMSYFEHPQLANKPTPKYRGLVALIAGLGGSIFTATFLLLGILINPNIRDAQNFKRQVSIPLLQQIPKLGGEKSKASIRKAFTESLKMLRNSIENKTGNIFLFTSSAPHTGKSLVLIKVAELLTKKGKRVLIIDTNLKDQPLEKQLSEHFNSSIQLNPIFVSLNELETFQTNLSENSNLNWNIRNFTLDYISHNHSEDTPIDICGESAFQDFVQYAKNRYDYVFMEGPALNDYADSRELLPFVDQVVMIFSADQSLKSKDSESISYLNSAVPEKVGAILNRVDPKTI